MTTISAISRLYRFIVGTICVYSAQGARNVIQVTALSLQAGLKAATLTAMSAASYDKLFTWTTFLFKWTDRNIPHTHTAQATEVSLRFTCPVFNSLRLSGAYMRQYNIPTLLQIMACRLFGAKALSEPMLSYCRLDHYEYMSVKSLKFKGFHSRNSTLKCCLRNVAHFVSFSMC